MNIVVMTKITVLAIIAIVAAAPIVLTTELSGATLALAQVMDNNNTEDATMMGNLTGGNTTTGAGNTTEGNMTELAGEISGRSKRSCNELC